MQFFRWISCIFHFFVVSLHRERKDIVKTITPKDYSEGPIRNMLNRFGDLWVFGKDVKGQEVYIKICYGLPNRSTICISFHVAEFPMNYPYKKGGQS